MAQAEISANRCLPVPSNKFIKNGRWLPVLRAPPRREPTPPRPWPWRAESRSRSSRWRCVRRRPGGRADRTVTVRRAISARDVNQPFLGLTARLRQMCAIPALRRRRRAPRAYPANPTSAHVSATPVPHRRAGRRRLGQGHPGVRRGQLAVLQRVLLRPGRAECNQCPGSSVDRFGCACPRTPDGARTASPLRRVHGVRDQHRALVGQLHLHGAWRIQRHPPRRQDRMQYSRTAPTTSQGPRRG